MKQNLSLKLKKITLATFFYDLRIKMSSEYLLCFLFLLRFDIGYFICQVSIISFSL